MTLNPPIPIAEMKIRAWHVLPEYKGIFDRILAKAESELKPPFSAATRNVRTRGDVAYIDVVGVLLPSATEAGFWRSWGFDATGYDEIRSMLAVAIADPAVRTIVLMVSSPGGTVAGTIETADAIWIARQKSGKAVIALVDQCCCSAAYYMASQAEQIIAEPNAVIGSIGTLVIYSDTSKMYEQYGVRQVVIKSGEFKGGTAAGVPITEEQVKMIQPVIDGMAGHFIEDVARGRGMKSEQVRSLATGAYWLAEQAMSLKLIDRVSRTNTYNGVSKMEMTEQEQKKIAQDAVVQERKRMTELSQAFPDDPQFVQEQVAAGSDLTTAKAAYADKLSEKLVESKAATEQAQAELARVKAQGNKVPPKKAGGCPPLDFSDGGDNAGTASKDFVAQARERAKERNITVTQAMRELAKMDPAGHRAWVESQGPLPII